MDGAGLDGLQEVYNFLRTSSHLRDYGAVLTLCGMPVAGWFFRKFMFITQVGGKHGCKECRDVYMERKMRQRESK